MSTDTICTQVRVRLIALTTSLVVLAGCAAPPSVTQSPDLAAAQDLREARSFHISTEARAAHYLDAADLTAPRLGSGRENTVARQTYNAAAAELTALLRSEDVGRLWNHPLTLTSPNKTYHLHLQPAGYGVWSPDYFTSFTPSEKVEGKLIKKAITQDGVGGSLVGIRNITPRENFAPPQGTDAAVTATLDFKGRDVTLALRRPTQELTARVEGRVRPLAADFSAPISYYQPPANLLLVGFLAAFRSERYMEKTGLYFLQPYDADRIPVVLVHGLFSTPFNWVKAVNGLQADPNIRKHYQFWVFGYPTGNPILYSALRLREELARVDKIYPNHRPYVIVGHSMGGMITRAQIITVSRSIWEKDNKVGETAKGIFARNPSDSLVVRAMTFRANHRIKRVVFVCTPHRGSNLASSGIGRFGISLITLPGDLMHVMKASLTDAQLTQLMGTSKRFPTSISGMKPSNPALPVLNSATITVPYHSIIADRGRGDSPNSSDGVVGYSSSHLDGAKSECIVPGGHSSCELPETITELNRILELHLKNG